MIDVNVIGEVVKLLNEFNCYTFYEDTHTYYYHNQRVQQSVTKFIKKYFPEFDSDTISKKYAEKHGLTQEEVLADWKRNADISALSGTAIHTYLENAKRGKVLTIDFSKARELGLEKEVLERYEILLPKAKAFHEDTLGKLFPIQLEYTVGVSDLLAGNIDMLCWNAMAQEIQIWDYKNTKEISKTNNFGKYCNSPFNNLLDCNYIHYSLQLNVYKALLRRVGIPVGKMYLVHFDYTVPGNEFTVHECRDFQEEINVELDKLIGETNEC